jgi:transcription antitermination protein NusB
MRPDAPEEARSGPRPTSSGEGRHRGREAALQILYEWEVGRFEIAEAVAAYWRLERAGGALPSERFRDFASDLASGTVGHLAEVDALIAAGAHHWRLERMAVIDRLILRLAVFEFLFAGDVPRLVVINEAVELAKTFSGDDGARFVNGILDGIRRQLDVDPAPGAPSV